MATVKTTYVSEYVLETARAKLPADELDRRLLKLEQDAARLEERLASTGAGFSRAGSAIGTTGNRLRDARGRFVATGDAAKKAGDDVKKFGDKSKSAESGLRGLVSRLRGMRSAIAALGIVAVAGFLGSAAEAWNVQERAVGQVEARLRSTGNVIGLTVKEIKSYASGIQELTGVGDELLLQQSAVLLSFKNITREAFPGALKAALDLSVGLGVDLNSAVLQVAKALDDPIRGLTALRRSGTIFSEEQEKVIQQLVATGKAGEAQMLILKELDSQYGGSAEAARQAGIPFAALGTELGDLMEEIGALLGVSGLKGIVESLISVTRATKNWLASFREAREQVADGRRLFEEYKKSLDAVADSQDKVTAALERTTEQIAAQARFQQLLSNINALLAAQADELLRVARAQEAATGFDEAIKPAEDYTGAIEAARKALADFVQGLKDAKAEGRIDEFLGLRETAGVLGSVNPELENLSGLLSEIGRLETDKKIEKLADAWTEHLGAAAPNRQVLLGLARQFIESEAAEKRAEDAAKRAAEEEKKRLKLRREEVDAFYKASIAAKVYRDATGTGSIAPISAAPFHDAGQALANAADELEDRLDRVVVHTGGTVKAQFHSATKEGLSTAARGFLDDMTNVALSFGQALADQFHTGPVHDAAFSLFQAAGQAGGAALGSAIGIGPQAGAAIGGIVTSLFKGLFSRGSDEAYAALSAVDDQLQVVATTIEGRLEPALTDLTSNIIQSVNTILAEFGGTLVSGEFGVKIRRGGEDVVRAYWSGVVTEFETEAEAASFLVAKILSTSLITGLGESVREALQGGDFASAEELVASLRFAEGIDNALRTPLEQFLASVARDTRTLLSTAADLGISVERATQAERARIQALVDEAAALVRSVGGVQGFLDQWDDLQRAIAIAGPAGVAKLEEQLRSAADAALGQARAAGASAEAFETSRESFESMLDDLGLSAERVKNLGQRFQELAEAGVPAEEVVAELLVSIEGLSQAEIQQALRNFRQNFVVDLLGQLATLADRAGKGRLAEELRGKALALSTEMQLLSIRTTLEQARAAGILTDEQVRGFNAVIQEIQRGIQSLGGFGALAGAGGGGHRPRRPPEDVVDVRTREQALEDFNRIMQETSDELNGVTAEERRRLDVIAQLDADLAAGLLTADEYRRAIENLDAVMAASAARVASEVTERWADIGASIGESPLASQLRRFAQDAMEGIAAGGEGIPETFAAQVEAWILDAIENADTVEERRALQQTWRDFLESLPPELRRSLRGSGIGRAIADGVAESVAAENIARIIATVMSATSSSILFGDEAGTAPATVGGQGGRSGIAETANEAADELARLREELSGFLESSRRSGLGPLRRQLDDVFDRFARAGSILRTLNAAAEQWNETAERMAGELGRFWESTLASVRDLLAEIRGTRQAPVEVFTEARAQFQALTANLPADLSSLDPDQIKAIVEAGRALRSAGGSVFGEGFGSGIVDKNLEAVLMQLEDLAPSQEDLILEALKLLREQSVLELQEANRRLGSSGPIALAVTDSAGSTAEASDLQLVELAKITGSLAGTISVLDELSPDQVAELRATVDSLLALEYLSEEQRRELQALKLILDTQEIIDTLKGTLAVSDTLSRDELESVIALLSGTIEVADQLAPSQVEELRSVVDGLLALTTLSAEQRAALEAARASLGAIDTSTAGAEAAAEAGATETARVRTAVDLLGDEIQATTRALNKLDTVIARIGAGDLNDEARRIRSKLDTVIDRLSGVGLTVARLDTIAARIGEGNVNAKLDSIDKTLKAMKTAGGFGTAG